MFRTIVSFVISAAVYF